MKISEKNHLPEGFRKLFIDGHSDTLKISIMTISPANNADIRGIIQIVHGMCEHKERYIPLMQYLSAKGFYCIIHDHRGHGESVRCHDDLGYFYDGGYNSMVEEIGKVNTFARKENPDIPLILLGHSMGSMAVRTFVKRNDSAVDALIVCGSPSNNPAAGIGKMIAGCFEKISGGHSRPSMLQKMSFGAFNKKFKHEGSPNAWICSDRETVKAYDSNPLCTFCFTANGFRNLFSLMQETYSINGWKVSRPELPVLFISGAEDPCAAGKKNFLAAVDTMKKVGYKNISWKFYGGMRHEILNETDKAIVWKDIFDFASKVKL